MRFLCDEMRRLGKWLRAAGYETVIAEGGLPDRVVAARYAAEDRILSTGDRHLAATLAGVARALLIAENSLDEIAAALSAALDLDWQRAPFTRCIVDNHPLEPASADLAARVPEKSRAAGGLLRLCPDCGRVYWPGGNVRRMQQRLAQWQNASGAPD